MATTITFPGPGGEAHPATTAALHFVGPKGLAVATNPAGTTVVLTQGEAGFTLFGDVAVARHVCKLGGAYGVDADGQSLVRASWVVFGGLHPAPPPLHHHSDTDGMVAQHVVGGGGVGVAGGRCPLCYLGMCVVCTGWWEKCQLGFAIVPLPMRRTHRSLYTPPLCLIYVVLHQASSRAWCPLSAPWGTLGVAASPHCVAIFLAWLHLQVQGVFASSFPPPVPPPTFPFPFTSHLSPTRPYRSSSGWTPPSLWPPWAPRPLTC